MGNLSRASQSRCAHWSVTTRFKTEVHTILEKVDIMLDVEGARLEAINSLLANTRLELKEQDYHILGLVKANEVETEARTSSKIEFQITEIIARIQCYCPSERRAQRQCAYSAKIT